MGYLPVASLLKTVGAELRESELRVDRIGSQAIRATRFNNDLIASIKCFSLLASLLAGAVRSLHFVQKVR